jgi:hypothetical protein
MPKKLNLIGLILIFHSSTQVKLVEGLGFVMWKAHNDRHDTTKNT